MADQCEGWCSIILYIILGLESILFIVSSVLLWNNREKYPIKQLSPRLTFLIGISILFCCIILAIVSQNSILLDPQNHQTAFDLLNNFYIFFRVFIIITFYFRFLRICLAYIELEGRAKIFYTIFGSEFYIAILSLVISVIPFMIQQVQQLKSSSNATQFFPFFQVRARDIGGYFEWAIFAIFFFLVLILSLRVDQKFRFLKTLVFMYILHHLENVYSIIYRMLCIDSMQQYQFFVPMILLIICYVIFVQPSFKRRQYEHPLPNQLILADYNMVLLYKEAYLILSRFSNHLESGSTARSDRSDRNRFWSKYLEIYTEFKIVKKQITRNTIDNHPDTQADLLKQYAVNYILPNLDEIASLGRNVLQPLLIEQSPNITIQNIKPNLTTRDFRQFDLRLNDKIRYMYGEWKKTNSKNYLEAELKKNNKVITNMQTLNISL